MEELQDNTIVFVKYGIRCGMVIQSRQRPQGGFICIQG